MFNKAAEKTASNFLFVGATFTCLFIVLSSVTDPVNVTKLTAVGGLGFASLFLFLGFQAKEAYKNFKWFLAASILFLISIVNASISSSAPFQQNLYGAYGRNTGLIAYLSLTLVAVGALMLRNPRSFSKMIWGLQIAGLINVFYCTWVLVFGDFLSWTNPYGNILGLFGNPNFISAFLGLFIATLIAQVFGRGTTWKYKAGAILISLVAFYEIIKSNSIQGIVVTAGGLAIVLFFAIRAYVKSVAFTYLYLVAVGIVGFLAILGTLQKGPLSFVYKTSVSLRGEYWAAGIKMGMDHPLTGVGMDTYGDWYRRARSLSAATVLPGPSTMSNASHNVVIDFFAYGGWPLLLSYLAMLGLAAISIVKVLIRTKKYDSTFVAMVAAWTCYEVQSLISINQIGLAVWGWLLTGALVAYEFATRPTDSAEAPQSNQSRKLKQSSATGVISPQLVGGLGALIGVLIAVPPLSADAKWRSAVDSKDSNRVMAALEPGYLNPMNSARLAQAVQLFANNNLLNEARKIALQGIEFNPGYFDAWRMIYLLPNSTEQEKTNALRKMKALDPLNPDVVKN